MGAEMVGAFADEGREDREGDRGCDEHGHVGGAGELEGRRHDDAEDRDDGHRERRAAEQGDDADRRLGVRLGHRPHCRGRLRAVSISAGSRQDPAGITGGGHASSPGRRRDPHGATVSR
jgi:hypothetical protein